jgi:hypothetical protein
LHSWAASVLLWAITSVGRWSFSMVKAIVAVLPDPVAPRRVWNRSPFSIPATRPSRALGWSATGT